MLHPWPPFTPPIINLSVPFLLESLQKDLPHLTYLRDEAVIHYEDLLHEFNKIQDYFHASMQTLAARYVRKSEATIIEKFCKSAYINRIPDYPYLLNELSMELCEFVIACQKQQYEEELEAARQAQVSAKLRAEAEANKKDEEEEQRQLFEAEQQRLVDIELLAEYEDISWLEEEIQRMAEQERQQLLQVENVVPQDSTSCAGPSDPIMEARLTAQEEKQCQMDIKLDSLAESQEQIIAMLAQLTARNQPTQP
ncbi:hypothetical protein TSUD_327510 [Trifolium subterraneum]|uniref:Uncharacterized protein n=1 Tax=Trifolium subterraneum TaxID=3900 RepID=A0A2Z6NT39_TRISU|nr:hypothetical protein TSUD_327510 [Trifolium subterraneum]